MCHDPNIDTFKNVNYFTIALLSVFLAIMADIAEEESGESEVMYCLVKISYQCGWEAISCYLRFPVNSGKVEPHRENKCIHYWKAFTSPILHVLCGVY